MYFDCHDEVATIENCVAFRCTTRQSMEIRESNRSFAPRPAHDHSCVKRCKGHSEIRWMGGYARVGPSEDRVIAIEAMKGRAARARPPLVAGEIIFITEVGAARALHDVTADR